MSTLVPFESRYLANLNQMVREELTRQYEILASGTLIKPDAGATSIGMARLVGYVEGLKAALGYMQHVHEDMTGKVKRKKEED